MGGQSFIVFIRVMKGQRISSSEIVGIFWLGSTRCNTFIPINFLHQNVSTEKFKNKYNGRMNGRVFEYKIWIVFVQKPNETTTPLSLNPSQSPVQASERKIEKMTSRSPEMTSRCGEMSRSPPSRKNLEDFHIVKGKYCPFCRKGMRYLGFGRVSSATEAWEAREARKTKKGERLKRNKMKEKKIIFWRCQ